MKKLITICLLMTTVYTVNAQNETETIQWINAKKVDIMVQNPPTNQVSNFNEEKISSHLFSSSEDNAKYHVFIKWSDITDISYNNESRDILIKGKVVSASGKNYIVMSCDDTADKALIDKMIKALTHMATLKGATMVKDDLFGN